MRGYLGDTRKELFAVLPLTSIIHTFPSPELPPSLSRDLLDYWSVSRPSQMDNPDRWYWNGDCSELEPLLYQPSGLTRIFVFKIRNFSSYSIRPTGPDGRAGPLRYSCMSFDVLLRVLAVDDNSCIHVIGSFDASGWLTCHFIYMYHQVTRTWIQTWRTILRSPSLLFLRSLCSDRRNQGIRPYVEFSQAISYLSSNTLFNLHGSPNFLYAFPHAQPPRWLHKRTAWERTDVLSAIRVFTITVASYFLFSNNWCPADILSGVLYFSRSTTRPLAMRIRDRYKYSSRKFFRTIILHIIKSCLNTDDCHRRHDFLTIVSNN
jgi:hypothetical protein